MLAAMYSAFAELNATDFCFLLNQETTPDPMLKQQPQLIPELHKTLSAKCLGENVHHLLVCLVITKLVVTSMRWIQDGW